MAWLHAIFLAGLAGLLQEATTPTADDTFTIEIVEEDGTPLDGIPFVILDLERTGLHGRPRILHQGGMEVFSMRGPGRAPRDAQPLAPGRRAVPLDALAEIQEESRSTGRARRVVVTPYPFCTDSPRTQIPAVVGPDSVVRLVIPRDLVWLWRPVEVRVVDSADRPVPRVPLSLHPFHRERKEWLSRGGEVASDADGRARVWGGVHPRHALAVQEMRLIARLAFPEPLTLALGPEVAREGSVEIRIPAHGAVSLRVEVSDGSPVPEGLMADLACGAVPNLAEAVGAPVESGRARFPIVGLGQTLRIEIREMRTGRTKADLELPGPVEPGEEVEAMITLDPEPVWPLARLRLRNPDGSPQANRPLAAVLSCRAAGRSCRIDPDDDWALSSDGEGRVAIPIPHEWSEGHERPLLLCLWKEETGGVKSQQRLSLDLSFPIDSLAGVDLGDVVVTEPPVFLEGWVIDSAGRPQLLAHVSVWPEGTRDAGENREWPWGAYTDPDGRFRVRGDCLAEHLTVEVSKGWCSRSRLVKVPRGESELVVELPEAGRLEFRMVLDEGFQSADFQLRLSGPAGPCFLFWNGHSDLVGPQPRYDFGHEVPAGLYTLEVLTEFPVWTVARLEGVAVPAGGAAEDPRLHPLDLRGRLRRASFLLRAPGGEPVPGTIDVRVDADRYQTSTDESGKLDLLISSSAKEIELSGEYCLPDCLPLVVAPPSGLQTLTFSPR